MIFTPSNCVDPLLIGRSAIREPTATTFFTRAFLRAVAGLAFRTMVARPPHSPYVAAEVAVCNQKDNSDGSACGPRHNEVHGNCIEMAEGISRDRCYCH